LKGLTNVCYAAEFFTESAAKSVAANAAAKA